MKGCIKYLLGAVGIVIVFIVLITISGSKVKKPDQTVSPVPTATANPQATPAAVTSAKFENIGKKIDPSMSVVAVQEGGEWEIAAALNPASPILSGSKQIARDFIFACYATGAPIKNAGITIAGGGKNYAAYLGKNQAATQPSDTWKKSNTDIGPTVFYDFLKKRTTSSTEPDMANRTYVETNLQ